MRVTHATNGGGTHPQNLHLVRVQPQPILLHPFQYGPQAALKEQDGITCSWKKGDVELRVIRVLMTQRSTPPDLLYKPTYVSTKSASAAFSAP